MSDRRFTSEHGDIVLGWLIKLIVSLAIVGVVAFEGGAVVVAHVNADTAANDAAGEAALMYSHAHNVKAAEAAARESAKTSGASLVAFTVATDGRTVTVIVEKVARTLLIQRLSATRSWGVVRVTVRRAVPD